MQQSLVAEMEAMFAFLMAVYEQILTPHQVVRMWHRALPWMADILAIIQLLGATT